MKGFRRTGIIGSFAMSATTAQGLQITKKLQVRLPSNYLLFR
jgi:hypothetical protein